MDVNASDGIMVIKPDGDIRVKNIVQLRKVFEQLERRKVTNIAIDLAKVNFIDSSGIGILLNYKKIQRDNSGYLCLFSYSDDVKELLDLIDLGDFIPLFKNYDEMKQAISN